MTKMTTLPLPSALAAFLLLASQPFAAWAGTAAGLQPPMQDRDRVSEGSLRLAQSDSIPVVPPEPDELTDPVPVPSADDPLAELLRVRDRIKSRRGDIEARRSTDLEQVEEAWRANLAAIAPKDMFESKAEHRARDAQEKSAAAQERDKSTDDVNRKYDALLKEEVEPLFQRVSELLSREDLVPEQAIDARVETYDAERGVFIGDLKIDFELMETKARFYLPMKERADARAFWENRESLKGRIRMSMDVQSLDIELKQFWLEDSRTGTRTSVDLSVEYRAVGEVFRDCGECPELVVVPSGSFMMGSPSSEAGRDDDEGPRHRVTIARPFAVGVYQVMFSEWDACRQAGGCSRNPSHEGWGRGRRPVINVGWKDAQEYVRWLSKETGEGYRLLSESEWEYIARAGTTGPYHFGSTVSPSQANYARRRWSTVPVGSFSPNAYGLYDVHGNVWEWVEDCWHNSYRGAPSDGSAWTRGGDCGYRVLRGGAWYGSPTDLRSANRERTSRYSDDSIGFRVARTLD